METVGFFHIIMYNSMEWKSEVVKRGSRHRTRQVESIKTNECWCGYRCQQVCAQQDACQVWGSVTKEEEGREATDQDKHSRGGGGRDGNGRTMQKVSKPWRRSRVWSTSQGHDCQANGDGSTWCKQNRQPTLMVLTGPNLVRWLGPPMTECNSF